MKVKLLINQFEGVSYESIPDSCIGQVYEAEPYVLSLYKIEAEQFTDLNEKYIEKDIGNDSYFVFDETEVEVIKE